MDTVTAWRLGPENGGKLRTTFLLFSLCKYAFYFRLRPMIRLATWNAKLGPK